MLPEISQSPRDPNFYRDPYPFYEAIRNLGPLVKWKEYGIPVTVNFDLVNSLLRDRRFGRQPPNGFFSNITSVALPFFENESRSMLEREPPIHTRLKSLAISEFTSRKLKKIENEILFLSNSLIQGIERKKFDIIKEFSEKLPVIVITRILGIPEEMAPRLLSWSHDMVAMYQARKDNKIEDNAARATLEFTEYLKKFIITKKKFLNDDLISYLIISQDKNKTASIEEIISTLILILNAGHEATVHTLSNGIKTMLESQLDKARLIKNPTTLANEVLRFNTPLHLFTRYAYEDAEIVPGQTIESGQQVGLLLAAANRDPKHFPEPNIFNPFRTENSHLSLGAGIHFCLGAQLARLELKIALPTIFKKMPSMKIVGSPEYKDHYHFYGLKSLTVSI